MASMTVDKTRDGAERSLRGHGSGARRQCDGIMIRTKKGWPSWRPAPAQDSGSGSLALGGSLLLLP